VEIDSERPNVKTTVPFVVHSTGMARASAAGLVLASPYAWNAFPNGHEQDLCVFASACVTRMRAIAWKADPVARLEFHEAIVRAGHHCAGQHQQALGAAGLMRF